jgi:hypothetical protein
MNEIVESSSGTLIRRCGNIKSKNSPDAQCKLSATYGEFCSRHWKHPTRYNTYGTIPSTPVPFTKKQIVAVIRIQTFWKKRVAYLHFRQHGPGRFIRELSKNDLELYTLDPVREIPKLYFFSFVDSGTCMWSFDIRALAHLQSMGELKVNPYNRETISDYCLNRIRNRLTWLRSRKYSVFFPVGVELTSDQIWRQKILDVFMKIESYGFHVSCDWFTEMSIEDHKIFYKTLFMNWFHRLGLTHADREKIVPQYMSEKKKLFRYNPESFDGHKTHTKHWWEKLNLSLAEAFLTRSPDKENLKLGAMYCVMGLVAINEKAADVFPWF